MKKNIILLMLLLCPFTVFGYSNEVYLGGKTIGIEIESDGVMIVGFYKINGSFNKGSNELNAGDYILKVDNKDVDSLNELTLLIEESTNDEEVDITFKRGTRTYETTLDLVKDDGIYKTGIYVKDSITGIGTLTYIDPKTNIYGALGHEIIESNTNTIVEIKSGLIFKNYISSIDKSSMGNPGSKNAKFEYSTKFGIVNENTKYGIYGEYRSSYDEFKLVEVGSVDDVKIGDATIYTVLEDEKVEEFTIKITKINETSDIKNITFEITDEKLIDATGGVVQGMSGSPIMQNGKLIGAITHVIVDNPVTGYGLFITTMLEEGEN